MGSGLTVEQQNLIVGTLLGDGSIEKRKKNPRLRIDHSVGQKDYVFWKYDILKNIATREPHLTSQQNKVTGRIDFHWYFSTKAMPELEFYYQLFYQDGKKIIRESIINYFDQPLSLAVWLMDDGYKRNDCDALRFSTDCFSYAEQLILQKCLDKNFGIKSKLHRKQKTWNIYVPSTEMVWIRKILDPYITDSMKYKLPPRNDLVQCVLDRIAVS